MINKMENKMSTYEFISESGSHIIKGITYNDVSIFPRIDYYTAVFSNLSIVDLVDLLQIPFGDSLTEILFKWFLPRGMAWGRDAFVFDFGGFQLGIDRNEFYAYYGGIDDPASVPMEELSNHPWRWLRLNISGSGLDMIRDADCDIDSILTKPFELPEGTTHHVTRVDFAYDLIDYMDDFIDVTYDCIKKFEEPYADKPGCCFGCIGNSMKGMTYEAHFGGRNKTLYIGSTSSDKLLRLYDKKLQYSSKGKLDQIPYRDELTGTPCKSWIRIELQLRKDAAQQYIFENDYEQILLLIYNHFVPREGKAKESPRCQDWVALWDWGRIKDIIQNRKSVDYSTPAEKATAFVDRSIFTLATFVACYGFDSLAKCIYDGLLSMQSSSDTSDQARWKRRKERLVCAFGLNSSDLPPFLNFSPASGKYFIDDPTFRTIIEPSLMTGYEGQGT